MNGRIGLSAAIAMVAIAACSDQNAASPPLATVDQNSVPREIKWDDLLPDGEIERLEEAYAAYYGDLETQMNEGASMMTARGPGSVAEIEEGSELDAMPQLGTFNTVTELNNEHVSLPGFIVPLEYAERGKLRSFLLVPYYGACIHTPPPPPNQIVYVEGEVAFTDDDMYAPYWVDGIMTTSPNMNDIGNAAYTINLTELRPYMYE